MYFCKILRYLTPCVSPCGGVIFAAMNILLVEDDLELARSVSDYFREQGYTVHHCVDGVNGLSSAWAESTTASKDWKRAATTT